MPGTADRATVPGVAVQEAEADTDLDVVGELEPEDVGVEAESVVEVGEHEDDVTEPLVAGDEAGHRPARHELSGICQTMCELMPEAPRVGE